MGAADGHSAVGSADVGKFEGWVDVGEKVVVGKEDGK